MLALCLLTLAACAGTARASPAHDAYLRGYISAVIDRELGWPRDSYDLVVEESVATLTLPAGEEARRAAALEHLGDIEGLKALEIATAPPELPVAPPGRASEWLGITATGVPLAAGDLFRPLLADPKQPRFFVSARRYDTLADAFDVAAVGYGETFGLYRRQGKRAGDGLQFNIAGGLFAQFNLDSPSFDLINADYTVGFPVTYRQAPWSARLRLYHQSSHLGDEFLLRTQPERVNLSYESLELLVSREGRRWRVYGGGEVLVHRDPEDLDRLMGHWGLEYHGATRFLGLGRLTAGVDVKNYEEHDWAMDTSIKAGLEFGQREPGRRHLRILAEVYKGFAPHGQFYTERITYFGLGVAFGL